ncbi:YncE family protein [Limnohabitans sp. Rim8]|uniref:YncE family protein n=1 Tax=Limnohabitans sp. Rim8 TaxID=1100718 RepID=UPI0011B217FD|nr:hypothetical protein [Limnohabitans sp. Rim8]
MNRMNIKRSIWMGVLAAALLGCGGGGGGGSPAVVNSQPPVTPPVPVAFVSVFGPTIAAPKHLVFSGANLYVAYQSGILVLNSTGSFVTSYSVADAVGIGVQSGLVYHTGNITSGEDTIFELGSLTPKVAYALNNFDGMVFYASNMLFVANSSNVLAYTNFSNPVFITGLGATPMAMAADTLNARIYLTLDDNKIGFLNPTNPSAGLTVLTEVTPAKWGPLQKPNGVVVSSTGFAYVVNQGDPNGTGGYISKINTTTGATETLLSDSVGNWGSLAVGFCGPIGITLDGTQENLYVTNGSCLSSYSGYGNSNKILKIKLP